MSTSRKAPTWRADIQGLRALAVIFVVAFHAGLPVPGGFTGVDVFFVISGFVITSMLYREHLAHSRIRFGRFYARRFKRLTPALALMICVTLLASVVLLAPVGPQQTAAKTGIGATLITANIVIAMTTGGYFDSAAALNPLLNTWSLSVEEQFYLVFPLVLALGWWLARRGRNGALLPLLLVGIFGALSLGLSLYTATGRQLPHAPLAIGGFYSPVTRAWEFAAGALLALVVTKGKSIGRRLATWCGVFGVVLLVTSLFAISESTPFPGPWTLVPVVGTLLVIAAGSHGRNPVSRLLSTSPAVRVGDLSYSWYLWHWPMIVFAGVVFRHNPAALIGAAMLSLIPAMISFRYIESPIRTLQSVSRRRFAALLALTVVPPLVIGGIVLLGADRSYHSAEVRAFQSQVSPAHLAETAGCHPPAYLTGLDDNPCAFNATAAGKPIYLVGDSNAAHFSEAVLAASKTLDRPLLIDTIDSCPAIDVRVDSPRRPNPFLTPCRSYIENTLRWLNQQAPGLVIIAGSDGLLIDPEITVSVSQGMNTSNATDQKSRLMETALVKEIEALKQRGHQVLLVQQVPHFVDEFAWDPRECTTLDIMQSQCSTRVPRSDMLSAHKSWSDVLTSAGAQTSTPVLDLTDQFCEATYCLGSRDGVTLYRDSSHISVEASELLAPVFARAISAASLS